MNLSAHDLTAWGGGYFAVWSAEATAQIASGATVTVGLASEVSAGNKRALLDVISGVEDTLVLRSAQSNEAFGSTASTGTTDSAPLAGDISLAVCYTLGAITINAAGGGLTLGNTVLATYKSGYEVLASGGADSGSFTLASGDDYQAQVVVFKAAGGAPAQHLAPSADSVDGTWTDNAAGTALAAAIDETSFSDADYIQSVDSPSAAGCRVKLATGTDPSLSTGHVIHWRIRKSSADQTVNMTVKLYQGGGNSLGAGTLIATRDRNNITTSFATFDETLTGTEADAITDYADLYLEFYATAS